MSMQTNALTFCLAVCYDGSDGGAQMVTIDAQMTDWKRFNQQVRNMGARGVRFAVSSVLNDLAFGARRYYPRHLDTRMDIRAKGFVRSSFGVKKGRPRDPRAYTFSKRRDNFTGWTEQQRGGDNRDRYGTLKGARGGSKSKRMRRKARLRPGKILNMRDISGKNTNQQLAKVLVGLRMEGTWGPFIAGDVGGANGGHMPWGLWTMGNLSRRYPDHPEYRTVKLLQRFDSPAKTDRWDWAGTGADKYIAQEDLTGKWMAAYAKSWRNAR